MRKLGGLAIAALLAIPALAMAPAASAAEEVGNRCLASAVAGKNTSVIQLAKDPANPLPIEVIKAGVATRWQVESPAPGPEFQALEVFRPTPTPKQFTLAGISTIGGVVNGGNSFETRIAVQSGDRFGLWGPGGGITCSAMSPANLVGTAPTTLTLGSAHTFAETTGRVAVAALVEPDADGDGYGDESQDKCPQDALYHDIPCPPLTLSFFSLAQRSSALVYVSAGVQSKIRVSAKAGKVKLKPVVHLANPGQITRYKLPFTGPLKAALAKLPESKSLALKITASGANIAGAVKSEIRTLRLKGRG